jgi:hypothetical protein
MALSERKFAAQILTPQGPRYYDDLGCALMAQNKDPELKKYPLYVVPDGQGGWQKAEMVRYREGMKTPMGYGYGAVSKDGGLSLSEVSRRMLLHQGAHHHD